MKNSFCRICRGRFNLKYPPAAVDSANRKSIPPRSISIRIAESGEVSENICWDCEETLLGFHKSIGEDDEEEEPVVVDDDEILYKSLEKKKRNHRLTKETEIIQIDSSDSDPEELVIVPLKETPIKVEAARTASGRLKKQGGAVNKNNSAKKNTQKTMNSTEKEDTIPRGRIFESKQCPLCPYHSGIEYEVVFHIRQTHPQYIGDDLRFDTKVGDSILTRRIIFAHLWTFFECKECGKIYDRFWPHRKHIATHDRNKLKSELNLNNNNKVSATTPKATNAGKSLKRPLDEIIGCNKSASEQRVKMFKSSNDNNSNEINKTLVIKLHKSESKTLAVKLQNQSEKSKSKALLRKQQQLQAKRERRRQKKEEEKKAALNARKKEAAPKEIISKPTFKMPTQPAPRASSIVKPLVQKLSFTCKMCSKIFPSFFGWNSHMIRYHSLEEFKNQNESSENICRSCDKHFGDANILQKHIRFFHRRKNRQLNMEVNGNDKDEFCCQSLAFKNKDTNGFDQLLTTDDLPLVIPSNKSDWTLVDEPNVCLSTKTASFCQYCGTLFTSETLEAHESSHIIDKDVKRFFITKPKV